MEGLIAVKHGFTPQRWWGRHAMRYATLRTDGLLDSQRQCKPQVGGRPWWALLPPLWVCTVLPGGNWLTTIPSTEWQSLLMMVNLSMITDWGWDLCFQLHPIKLEVLSIDSVWWKANHRAGTGWKVSLWMSTKSLSLWKDIQVLLCPQGFSQKVSDLHLQVKGSN